MTLVYYFTLYLFIQVENLEMAGLNI